MLWEESRLPTGCFIYAPYPVADFVVSLLWALITLCSTFKASINRLLLLLYIYAKFMSYLKISATSQIHLHVAKTQSWTWRTVVISE